jgi:subtilisin family serine protease
MRALRALHKWLGLVPNGGRVTALAAVAGLVALAGLSSDSGQSGAGHALDESIVARAVILDLAQDGTADFWVDFDGRADLSEAQEIKDWADRGTYVYDRLTQTAKASQADLLESLGAQGVEFESFWITNAVLVRGGDRQALDTAVGTAGVTAIRADESFELPDPVNPADPAPSIQAVEWGIANINADDAWSQFGVRGQGVVVANIDTGVDHTHPALAGTYRGTNGDGTVSHDYNWFDPSNVCPSPAPCDNNNHGTHTMGTMVGEDGANQIGVAPGATWIAAKGCEGQSCSNAAVIASGQWMLAPTKLDGTDPRPDLRPNVVNNSWGGGAPPFYQDIVTAWTAAGIFGVFANGNTGPGCQSANYPGAYSAAYGVGAYDSNNTIASFSSRGPGENGEVKPDIAAPGVNVRSSVPGGYAAANGTSMATPHVAGAVAMLWSVNPSLMGDIEGTRTVLDAGAVDTPNDQCGGEPADNNVFGEGRLDVLASALLAANGTGTLTGTVTDAASGGPIGNATVTVSGPIAWETTTGPDGAYSLRLVAGEYQVTIGGVFGYDPVTATVSVTAEQTTTHDAAMAPTTRVSLAGVVRDASGGGWPLHATVTATHGSGYRVETATDPETGAYDLAVVPNADYTVRVQAVVAGYQPDQRQVSVGAGGARHDVGLTITFDCVAPGYEAILDGVTESFDRSRQPRGWNVDNVDRHLPGYDHRRGWAFSDPGGRGNPTGAEGGFAIVDSDHYGEHSYQDTWLTSPVLDLSDNDQPAIGFATDLNPAVNGTAMIDVSIDGGRTWERVWTQSGFPGIAGPGTHALPLPTAAGERSVRVRLGYTGQWSGWWAVDDVFVGDRACTPAR